MVSQLPSSPSAILVRLTYVASRGCPPCCSSEVPRAWFSKAKLCQQHLQSSKQIEASGSMFINPPNPFFLTGGMYLCGLGLVFLQLCSVLSLKDAPAPWPSPPPQTGPRRAPQSFSVRVQSALPARLTSPHTANAPTAAPPQPCSGSGFRESAFPLKSSSMLYHTSLHTHTSNSHLCTDIIRPPTNTYIRTPAR